MTETKKINDWVRFEVEIKGRYAHDLTSVIKNCENDYQLKNLLLSAVLDKYMLFYTSSSRPHKMTKLMLRLLDTKNFTFTAAKDDISSLEESIEHIKKHSGLFSLLYKVDEIWGKGTSKDLLTYFYKSFKAEFTPNSDHKIWVNRYKRHYEKKGKPFEGGDKNESYFSR